MTDLLKIYWRLDFRVSYTLLDSRGSILRILSEADNDFVSKIGEGTIINSFVGESKSATGIKTISVEPTSFNGSIEWHPSIPLERFLQSDSFRQADRTVSELLKFCSISNFERVGLRCIFLAGEAISDTLQDPKVHCLQKLDAGIYERISTILGKPTDMGYIFDGTGADGLSYKITFGPYDDQNVDAHLAMRPSESIRVQHRRKRYFFDIDIFEENFTFNSPSLYRLTRFKAEKISKLSEAFSEF